MLIKILDIWQNLIKCRRLEPASGWKDKSSACRLLYKLFLGTQGLSTGFLTAPASPPLRVVGKEKFEQSGYAKMQRVTSLSRLPQSCYCCCHLRHCLQCFESREGVALQHWHNEAMLELEGRCKVDPMFSRQKALASRNPDIHHHCPNLQRGDGAGESNDQR